MSNIHAVNVSLTTPLASKDVKTEDLNIFDIPTLSSTTKKLIEELNEKVSLPKPLLSLGDRIKTLEESTKKLTEADAKLLEADASKVKDKVVGLLASASSIAVIGAFIFGGVLIGGGLGLLLALAAGGTSLTIGSVYHKLSEFSKEHGFAHDAKSNSGLVATLLLAGALLPAIDAYRKIPVLKVVKDGLEGAVKEQKEIVMKDFSDLLTFYSKVQAELHHLEKLAQTFMKKVEELIKELPKKVDELASDVEHEAKIQNIKWHQQAVNDLNSVEKFFKHIAA